MGEEAHLIRSKAMPAGPFAIGSTIYPGLAKLMEEAGEVVQVGGKIIATGGDSQHWDGSNLPSRLEEEMADLLGALLFFFDANGVDKHAIAVRARKKWTRFKRWHQEQA